MPERILSRDLGIPQTLEDAKKTAKSLAAWIDYIINNPLDVDNPMSSFGGHIDSHLAYLNMWFRMEKVKTSAEELKKTLQFSIKELEK